MARRLFALLALVAAAGCIQINGPGWARHHGEVGSADTCGWTDEACGEDDECCDEDECCDDEGDGDEDECCDDDGECDDGACCHDDGKCDDGDNECCDDEGECDDDECCDDACEEDEACEEECGDDEGECEVMAGDSSACAASVVAAASVDAEKLQELEWAIGAAERRLGRARAEQGQSEQDQSAALQRAREELTDAQRALRHFEGFEKPTRLAKAELDLKDSQDYATSQDEEMKQLELLYEKDDLGDKTKEIVLARGRRQHQRAQERLALAKRDFEDLKGFQLEQQRQKLARDLEQKQRDVARAEFTAHTTAEDKQQAVEEAERALIKARREFEKAADSASTAAK